MRVLAIDYGVKRTGLAISDESGLISRPFGVIQKANSSDGISKLVELVKANSIALVVVGLPIGLDGGETKQTARSRSFAARIRGEVGVPVELYDERFTSSMADTTAAITGSSASRDELAACHLLDAWIGAKHG